MEVNYTKKYIHSMYSFGTRKNCHKIGNNPLLFQFIKGERMDYSNYRGISLFSTSYKILSNILLSRMTPYANGIIEEISVAKDI